ncbi:hypothetical protein UK23_06035 [Lentzea aerocolonigenes]|uniref:Uncharacterized protein n=1 Tax=Lentzea aerocolonigenes TaxID=68170 RepID=A0A0F0H9Z1_LENAE|nr:ESX secretion-associated protein EspG [Lentzea aerocolonigenes]KJK51676.1 hypothetical protein UK23_06035 [Lentzea aerocolonigenes]
MSGEIVCSFVELDALGVALRLNVRQFPFSIPHFAVEAEERLRMGQDDLIARGLIRGDSFAPELEQALNVYARGRVATAMPPAPAARPRSRPSRRSAGMVRRRARRGWRDHKIGMRI